MTPPDSKLQTTVVHKANPLVDSDGFSSAAPLPPSGGGGGAVPLASETPVVSSDDTVVDVAGNRKKIQRNKW